MARTDNPPAPGPREFYSGKLSERDMLGEFRTSQAGRAAFRAAMDEGGYIQYEPVMRLIREWSEDEETEPEKPFASEMRMAIIEQLGLETTEDMDRIKFYTSVDTPMDLKHGVDGWFEFRTESGYPIVVTIDVTSDPGKIEHKADIIFHTVPDPSVNEDEFMRIIHEEYAPQVVARFKPHVETMMKARELRKEREQRKPRQQIQQSEDQPSA